MDNRSKLETGLAPAVGVNPPPTKPSSLDLPQWQRDMIAAATWSPKPARLPARLLPTTGQRSILRQDAASILATMHPGPMREIMGAVARLLIAFPATDPGIAGEARAEAYEVALEDLPAWAVAAACLDWLQGKRGTGGENYAFAPSPPQLRRLADLHASVARGKAYTLGLLAEAVAEPEFSDEHRREMQRRLGAIRISTDTAA